MKLLLDTCALLWLELDLAQIPAPLLRQLSDPSTECYLSAASVWEITVKWQAGKLPLPLPPSDFVRTARAASGIEELPIAEAAVHQLAKLPAVHNDPFDRMLICQAIEAGMAIVTPDEWIRRYPVKTLWTE